jgi:hypothetical protein
MHCILIFFLARIIVVRFLNQHNIDTRMMNKDNQYCYDKRNLHFYGNFHLSHNPPENATTSNWREEIADKIRKNITSLPKYAFGIKKRQNDTNSSIRYELISIISSEIL